MNVYKKMKACQKCTLSFPDEEFIHRGKWRDPFWCKTCKERFAREFKRLHATKAMPIPLPEKEKILSVRQEWFEEQQSKVLTTRKLWNMRHEAKKRGLRHDLTMQQWNRTLEHFHELCAYCQAHPWQNIDHVIPKSQGGGTWIGNVVPACEFCNRKKG